MRCEENKDGGEGKTWEMVWRDGKKRKSPRLRDDDGQPHFRDEINIGWSGGGGGGVVTEYM